MEVGQEDDLPALQAPSTHTNTQSGEMEVMEEPCLSQGTLPVPPPPHTSPVLRTHLNQHLGQVKHPHQGGLHVGVDGDGSQGEEHLDFAIQLRNGGEGNETCGGEKEADPALLFLRQMLTSMCVFPP